MQQFRRRVFDFLRRGLAKLDVKIERVLVAVSGGKDSISLLDVMAWIADKMGFEILGVTIDLGIDEFSKTNLRAAIRAYNTLGVEYVIVDARERLGIDTPCAHKAWRRGLITRPTCSVCGLIKRRLIEEVARDVNADAIATGHTLSDVLGFNLANLTASIAKRFAVVERGEFIRLKPLAVVSDSDTLCYVTLRGLAFASTPCPYKPERQRWRLYAKLLLESYRGLAPILAGVAVYEQLGEAGGRCVYCGSLSESAYCAACRVFSTIRPMCKAASDPSRVW